MPSKYVPRPPRIGNCAVCAEDFEVTGVGRMPFACSVHAEEYRKVNHGHWHRKYKYNLTPKQYENMVEGQGGVCKICNEDKKLYTDHNHLCCPGETSCGECVRGLICQDCNTGLGMFKDNPLFLKSALIYLEESS